MTFFLTPQNWSEIFLKYFLNISEIFLIIGDPYLLIFLDFCWFLVGMWLLSSFLFVSQPKSGKIRVFPNFQKKSKKSTKTKIHWYLQGKVCLGLAQIGSPDFWKNVFFLNLPVSDFSTYFQKIRQFSDFFKKIKKHQKRIIFSDFSCFFIFCQKNQALLQFKKKQKKQKLNISTIWPYRWGCFLLIQMFQIFHLGDTGRTQGWTLNIFKKFGRTPPQY